MRRPQTRIENVEWISIGKTLPEPFDLVMLLYEDYHVQPAWWTGCGWDSGKPLSKKRILAWKKVHDTYLRCHRAEE